MTDVALWLCTECRRIVEDTSREGYRGTGTDRPPCPHCRSHALVDPRITEHADVLEAMDEHDRLARLPRSVRIVGRVVRVAFAIAGLGTIALLLVALYFGVGRGGQVAEVLAMLFATLLAIPGGLLAVRSVRGHFARTRALPRPGRWALALPEGAGDVIARGVVACEEPLRSPLTAEICVAYEIGVRYDAHASGPLGTWLLLEQRCADLEVDGRPIAGQSVHLQLSRRALLRSAESDARVDHFLRERGIRPGRAALSIYETRVAIGDSVTAQRSANGVITLGP